MINRLNILIIFISLSLCSVNNHLMSNEDFIAGDDGVIRMYINIIGHVKSPGTHLVHDKIDFMSLISASGGYLPGANLKNILIYKQNGSVQKINLYKILRNENLSFKQINLEPHDTIFIEQKKISKFFISSNLPSLFLSLINLAVTLENTD